MSFINKFSREEISLKKFPIEIIRREPKAVAIFLMLFGLVFCGAAIFGSIQSYSDGKLTVKIFLLMSPFFLIGIGSFIFGYNFFVKKIKITINFDKVTFHSRSLFKEIKWDESFSNYKGILFKLEYDGDKQYNVLKLYHPDEEKTISLSHYLVFWVHESEVRAKWEEYSRLFKLPALQETPDGIIEREIEDLNKSSRDLVEEGKVDFNESEFIKPPKGIKVYFDRGSHVIAITKKRTLSPGILIVISIIAPLIYFGFFFKENPDINFILAGVFGLILGTYTVLYFVFDLTTTKLIKCSYEKIHILRKTPFGETSGKKMEVSRIEEINVAKVEHYNREALIMISDDQKINLGMGLSNEVLNWMRDFIYSKSIKD